MEIISSISDWKSKIYDNEPHKVTAALLPLKAIRAKCLECGNWQQIEVTECSIMRCPLYPYRTGHRVKH